MDGYWMYSYKVVKKECKQKKITTFKMSFYK